VQVYLPLKNEFPELEFYKSSSTDPWDPYQVPAIITLIYAQYESQLKAKRVTDRQALLVYPEGGKTPIRPATRIAYGYDKDFSIKHEEATIVEFIFRICSVGYSYESIASLLNDANIPSSTGLKWNPNTIDHMLSNRIYMGDFVWNNTLISEQYLEPIITLPLWNQVEEIKRLKAKYKKFNTLYSLRGVIYCETCNMELACKDETPGKSEDKYSYYVCHTCKNKVDISEVNELVRTRTMQEWQIHYESYVLKQERHIKQLMKDLMSKKALIIEDLRKTRLISRKDISSHDYNVLVKSKEIHESTLSFRLVEINDAIDNVRELLDYQGHPDTRSYYAKCDLASLTPVEFRTFCLTVYSKVSIRWKSKREISVQVDYRLHPAFIDDIYTC
jgi:hypothetical protein